MNKPFGYIYEIYFPINGKRYVGQTTNLEVRKNKYKNYNCKRQRRIYAALIKHGWENTIFSVLYECHSLAEMNLLEEMTICEYDLLNREKGYNIEAGGQRRIVSQETREKLRALSTGRKHSDETKEKLRQMNLGKKLSEEHCRKMLEARKGYKHSEESKKKIGEAGKGRIKSDEERAKLSKSLKGRKITPEWAAKTQKALKALREAGLVTNNKGRVLLSNVRNMEIYSFIHDDGESYIGRKREFSIKYNLDRSSVKKLIRGFSNQVKGWRLNYAPLREDN